ncbi:MAG: thiamine phosphate synthase [Rhodospirillales bacterium]|jgi:thiamine-phosphate pyrophosphorylase|nr:thiamine phosphate synthase [Rhodospirillales bacterium]
MPSSTCRLYLVTPPRVALPDFAEALSAAVDADDVACLQIRLKDSDDDEIRRAAAVLVPIAQARGVAVLMNDRPDLAAELGCDGVHIGQEDATYAEARRAVGADGIVGVTCHNSRHLAIEAGDAGADYVAFGAFFPTGTKIAKTAAEPDILEWWSDIATLPCVAIGGITVENCPALVRAGADFLAVVGGVWNHPDGPAAAVRAFNRAIAEAAST